MCSAVRHCSTPLLFHSFSCRLFHHPFRGYCFHRFSSSPTSPSPWIPLLNCSSPFHLPQILPRLMLDFASDKTQPTWLGYVYATMFFVTAILQSLCLHQYFNRALTLGMRVRTALMAAIYSKVCGEGGGHSGEGGEMVERKGDVVGREGRW